MKRVIVALVAIFAASVGAGTASASTGDVTKPEWKRVEFAYGMPKAQVERIFDATGDRQKDPLPNCTIIGGTPPQVYCGPQRHYWYKNHCDSSPVNIWYTFYLGKWVLTETDAYYPDQYPDKPGDGC